MTTQAKAFKDIRVALLVLLLKRARFFWGEVLFNLDTEILIGLRTCNASLLSPDSPPCIQGESANALSEYD